jgi:[ribosomal protein S18]-alanine N-acetyltransferase
MNQHPQVEVAPATEAQLPQLIVLAAAAGSAAHWSAQQWLDIFHTENPRRLAWVAWLAGERSTAAGFLVAQCGGPEWELENVAVAAGCRRRRVGSALVSMLFDAARNAGAERIVLEVRASNVGAIALYQRAGFEQLGRRPGYYRNPSEDALILARRL